MIRDFKIVGGYLIKYNSKEKDVMIPEDVTRIIDEAFAGCTIESVAIPHSVTAIDECAFRGCTELREVIMQDRLRKIGGAAFSGCKKLEEIYLLLICRIILYTKYRDINHINYNVRRLNL